MNEQAEREMWDMINRATPEVERPAAPAGLIAAQTTRTRRGELVVLLTDRMIEATKHDGRIATAEGVVIWYTLGKPFQRGGSTMRYGYLRRDALVIAERDRRRSQEAWNATMQPKADRPMCGAGHGHFDADGMTVWCNDDSPYCNR